MGVDYNFGNLDFNNLDLDKLRNDVLKRSKSSFTKNNDIKINNLVDFTLNKIVEPKDDITGILEDLYNESIFTSVIDAIVDDVFKDYKLIGKKSLIKKGEKFLKDTKLMKELKMTLKNELDSGYGFIEVLRDSDDNIVRFNNLDNRTVRWCSLRDKDSKLHKKFLRKYGDDYYVYNDFDNRGNVTDKIVNDVLICQKESSLDRNYGRGISSGIFVYVLLLNYIDTIIIPHLLKNEVLPKFIMVTNVVGDELDVHEATGKRELKKHNKELTEAVNDGYNPQNFIHLVNTNPNLRNELFKLDQVNDISKVMLVRDSYVLNIIQAYHMSPYRIGLILLGGLGGSTSEESNKVYGLNTVLNLQRKYERIVNDFLYDYFDSSDIEIEFERFTVEVKEAKEVDDKNEGTLEGGEK